MASIKDCGKIQSRLGDYIDGALPTEAAWETKLHLSSCAVCARAAQELQATVSLLQGLPRRETAGTFEEALARRLANTALQPRRPSLSERLREWWFLPRVRPALAAAGTFAVLIPAAFFVLNRPVSSPPLGSSVSTPVGQQFVKTVLEEHMLYDASEPLGDQTEALLVSASGASLGGDSSEEQRP